MKKDDFGNRMKLFEGIESAKILIPMLPAICRLDGRCFSSYTKNFARPYDERLSKLMVDVAKYLAEETNACMAYTQSDEITLAWLAKDHKEQIFFGGRIQKMVSALASLCTGYFNSVKSKYCIDDTVVALFDCRVWNVPNIDEGANAFLWREKDAVKNSISMAARSYYSHSELLNKKSKEMQELLWAKGVNWNNYPSFFKRGTFIQRKKCLRKFTAVEIEKLPLKHQARSYPDLMVERQDFVALEMPPFTRVINRPQVVFFGEEPNVVVT